MIKNTEAASLIILFASIIIAAEPVIS